MTKGYSKLVLGEILRARWDGALPSRYPGMFSLPIALTTQSLWTVYQVAVVG